ncbi:MAG TPA: hypothetical protein PLZ61_02280 [Candidatus Cryosericum sp.]|nr:hypothetical protein [Candidatus Cryosericum sp.]
MSGDEGRRKRNWPAGVGVHRSLPDDMAAREGVRRSLPHLGNAGKGVHRASLGHADMRRGECELWSEHLRLYMLQLADRLRRVRVCCGDWSRVTGPTPTIKVGNPTGIFLDPPYSQEERDPRCYMIDRPGLAEECLRWCLEYGEDPRLRIALCGYAGEGHEALEEAGWSVFEWKANGGYSNRRKSSTNANKHRERIWFSPHCLPAEDTEAAPMEAVERQALLIDWDE